MSKKPIIYSQNDPLLNILLILGFSVSLIWGIAKFHKIDSYPYLELSSLLDFLLPFSLFLFCLWYAFFKHKVHFYKHQILLKSPFGQRAFPIKKLQGWKTDKYHTKYGVEEITIIKVDNRFLVFNRSLESNYLAIKYFLMEHFPKIEDKHFRLYYLRRSIPRRIFFLGLAFFLFNSFFQAHQTSFMALPEQTQAMVLTLNAQPELHSKNLKNSRKAHHFTMQFQEYPDFEFIIPASSFDYSNYKMIERLQKGHFLIVGVAEDIAQSKLLKTQAPNFWTRHWHWDQIEILQLKFNDKTWLYASDVAFSKEDRREDRWVFLGFGILCLGLVFIKRFY